jgi:hypothetical protein
LKVLNPDVNVKQVQLHDKKVLNVNGQMEQIDEGLLCKHPMEIAEAKPQ